MLRELGRHTLILQLANMASKAAAILLVPIYTSHIPPAEFGRLSVLLAFTGVANIALSFGVQSAIYMRYLNEESEVQRGRLIGHAFWLVVLANVAGISLLLMGQKVISAALIPGVQAREYHLALAWLFCANIADLALVFFRIQGRTLAFAVYSFAQLVAGLSIISYLVVVRDQGVSGVLTGMTLATLVALPVLWSHRACLRPAFDREIVRSYARLGLPIMAANLLYWGTTSANRFFMNAYSSAADVGVFDIATRFSSATRLLVIVPFFQAWNYVMFKVRDQPDARTHYARIFSVYLCAVCGLATFAMVMTRPVVSLFVHPQYRDALALIPVLILAETVVGVHYFMVFGTAIHNVVVEHKTMLASAVVATVGNIVLIPTLHAFGAAVTLIAANATLSVATTWYSRKYYRFPTPWRVIIAAALPCIFVAIWSGNILRWTLVPTLAGAVAAALYYGALMAVILRKNLGQILAFVSAKRRG